MIPGVDLCAAIRGTHMHMNMNSHIHTQTYHRHRHTYTNIHTRTHAHTDKYTHIYSSHGIRYHCRNHWIMHTALSHHAAYIYKLLFQLKFIKIHKEYPHRDRRREVNLGCPCVLFTAEGPRANYELIRLPRCVLWCLLGVTLQHINFGILICLIILVLTVSSLTQNLKF